MPRRRRKRAQSNTSYGAAYNAWMRRVKGLPLSAFDPAVASQCRIIRLWGWQYELNQTQADDLTRTRGVRFKIIEPGKVV